MSRCCTCQTLRGASVVALVFIGKWSLYDSGFAMRLHRTSAFRILLASLLLFSAFSILVETASAQAELGHYWVTVNPTVPGLIVHSTLGLNWTISFQATWTYGSNSGKTVENATVHIEVRAADGTIMDTLLPATNATGQVSLSYSSSTPSVLTFVPTKLVTEDGVEWNSSVVEGAYGARVEAVVTIYWDSFDALLISADTHALEAAKVSVNITYLMVPQEGLTALQPPDYSQNDYVPKYVHGAHVKIDGVEAEETSVPGVYTAETSTWLPTAYILVEISQAGWPKIDKALGFTHNANEIVWASATAFGLVCVIVVLTYHHFSTKGTRGRALFKKSGFPSIGAGLSAIASFISVYWAMIGLESALHGFDWTLLAVFGIVAFIVGLAGSAMSKMKKSFAFALVAVCFPLFENTVVVKYSLDNYQLATPWMAIAAAIIFSMLGGISIGMSDQQFS